MLIIMGIWVNSRASHLLGWVLTVIISRLMSIHGPLRRHVPTHMCLQFPTIMLKGGDLNNVVLTRSSLFDIIFGRAKAKR